MLSNFIVALAVVCALFAQSHAKTYFKVRLNFIDVKSSDRTFLYPRPSIANHLPFLLIFLT
jgi:hypothetical protein